MQERLFIPTINIYSCSEVT